MSPLPIRIMWSRLAIRASAAIGSPWDPVQIRVILLSAQLLEHLELDHQALGDVQVAEVAGETHVADHRATDEGHLAAVLVGGVEHLLDAVHVAGKAGHHDPPRRRTEHLLDRRCQVALGDLETRDLGVGGVDEQQVDALLAEAGEGAQVGDPVVERELVHLEVAGVQDQARAGTDRDREGVRDRVVDGDELAVERAKLGALALAYLDGLGRDPVLLELGGDERQRELGADQRDVGAFAQQVGDARRCGLRGRG